ncbi:MBL fold metallo-hydrolase [Aristophania vespae]|uniref:MBL fold metallo-hydrolase n=1 Tax=Aristophania vespae TaxID=2697033 RepID=UPI001F3195BF|nr:MBL fold metallo-hydrolase [Aristophania vespae]
MVVDPGGESSKILEKLEGFDVQAILITHGHLDHAGGAAALKQALKPNKRKMYLYGVPEKKTPFFSLL